MDVPIRCICQPADEPARHPEGDTVVLRDKLDFRAVAALRAGLSMFRLEQPDAGFEDSLAWLAEGYLLRGIESWTLERDDAKGKPEPIPPSHDNIRQYLLSDVDLAVNVADIADDMYAGVVLLPLLVPASTSSPRMPTTGSTSRSKGSSAKPRMPSKRSSTTTSPTADIVKITVSHDGGSNSSQNSGTAA